jgi:hypothetical protein
MLDIPCQYAKSLDRHQSNTVVCPVNNNREARGNLLFVLHLFDPLPQLRTLLLQAGALML